MRTAGKSALKRPIWRREIKLGGPLVGALVVGAGGYFLLGAIGIAAGVAAFVLLALVGLLRAA